MDQVINFLTQYWWGLMLIGIAIYAYGIQRYFDSWDMDPILCTIIQFLGTFLILWAPLNVLWKQEERKNASKIILTVIIVIVVVSLAVLGNLYMWKKVPNNDNGKSQTEANIEPTPSVAESTTTPIITPSEFITTSTSISYPAAIALKQYFDDIIAADEYKLEDLYNFQDQCSDNSLEEYKNFWIELIPQYTIYACSEKNTFDVNIKYFYREYINFSKQTSDEDGSWERYVLAETQDGWEIIACSIINSNSTLCEFYTSNE